MHTEVNPATRLHDLIDAAAEIKRPCPIEAQVFMAQIVGLSVDVVMREALIERHANTPRGEKLVTALGKGLMGAGALSTTLLLGNDASASSLNAAVDLLRCIFRAFL